MTTPYINLLVIPSLISGQGAFHHACAGGDLDLVEALAARGGPQGMPDLAGPEGGKLLNIACDAGMARVAEWLLKRKVRHLWILKISANMAI